MSISYVLPGLRTDIPCLITLTLQVGTFATTSGWNVCLGHYVARSLRGQASGDGKIEPDSLLRYAAGGPEGGWRWWGVITWGCRRYGLANLMYVLFCLSTALVNGASAALPTAE